MHPSVAARLDAGRDRMLAEHRRVTALFFRLRDDLRGTSWRPPCARSTASTGRCCRSSCVDKGSTLKATFGAPLAHEDDERRAVACALALREELPGAAFGVSSGTVFCGLIGSAARREYTVLGDAVNVAARLMLAARPGQILATEAVRRRAGEEWAWRALGPLALRGRGDPVTAFELAGPLAPAAAHGRTRELERPRARARGGAGAARARRWSCPARPGSGSRGCSRRSWSARAGFTVVRGAGQPYGRDHAYGAWRDAARRWTSDRLLAARRRLTPEVRAAALRELVVDGRSAPARRCCSSFEDCSGSMRRRVTCSSASWRSSALPVLLVVTERGEAWRLPGARLGARAAPARRDRADRRRRAGGRRPRGRQPALRRGARPARRPATLPDSLRAVVNARLDRLGEDERAVLRVAAVVGTRFAPEWLSGSDPGLGDVAARLAALARLGVVHPEGTQYAFKHAVTARGRLRDARARRPASTCTRRSRATSSARAADADVLEALAHHYGHSADAGKQRVYFRRAGDAAREAFANESAIQHYRRLLPCSSRRRATRGAGRPRLRCCSSPANGSKRGSSSQLAGATARAALGGLLARTGAYPEAVACSSRPGRERRADLQHARTARAHLLRAGRRRAGARRARGAGGARPRARRPRRGGRGDRDARAGALAPGRARAGARAARGVARAGRGGREPRRRRPQPQRPRRRARRARPPRARRCERLAEAYALADEIGYRRFAGVIVGNAAELFQTLGRR